MRAFAGAGMECTLAAQYGNGAVIMYPDNTRRVLVNEKNISKRRFLADAVAEEIAGSDYCGAFIRFQFFCNNVEAMLSNMKKHGLKVVFEIPTYPYEPELKLQGLKGTVKLMCDRFFRKRCCRYIDLMAVSGSEKEVYSVPAFPMKNGLCMEDFELTECGYSPERLDMISVSSMMPWHGLERVIRGMAEYYDKGGKREVVLHAVGDGSEKCRYEALANELGLGGRVIFYGALFGEELDRVYDKCSVGLCALSAHIKNIIEGSPLKTVEYAARGLAVVTEMKLWFVEENSDFCLRIPWDDSQLDINAVIDLNDRLFSADCRAARQGIRKAVEKKCDMKQNLLPAIEFFTKM